MIRITLGKPCRITLNALYNAFCRFCIFLLLSSPGFSQTAIQINSIGEANASDLEIWVREKEDISGEIWLDKTAAAEIMLQLAWRRAGEDTWWIHKQTLPFQANSEKAQPWEFRGVLLGGEFDYKQALEIIAFAAPKDQPLPEGIIDYNSLIYLSLAVSNQVNMIRTPKTPDRLMVMPRIRIGEINGQAVKPGLVHEVGLKAILSGEVRKPTDCKIRLVAQPLGRAEYRVMDDEPLVRNGQWSGAMDFVSHGLDEETEFAIFAVIVKLDIPGGQVISLEEWQIYLQTHIIGMSSIIRATRVEIPMGENQVGVKIISVDDIPVNFAGEWEVRPRSNIKGMVAGRPLKFDEAIWVLAANEFNDSAWRVLGKAFLKNGLYWELPPQLLGESGEYLKLIAIVSQKDATALNKTSIEENIAFSRPVQIRLQNEPPITVRIQRIDKQTVGSQADLSVYRISSVEGFISGRPLQDDDQVWVLKTLDNDGETWQLLGKAGFKNKRDWSLPPVSLGDSGERLILVAVVSKSKIENMNLREQGNILASSDKVHVKLVD